MSKQLQNILYAPLGWFLHLLALLPWWAIYAQADVLYFLVYHVLRYRRKIVRRNLRDSFPEKSDAELLAIERESYHQFADYFMETIKQLHITDDEMRRRMVFHGVEHIEDALDRGRSVADIDYGQVYQPLENEWFDRFFLNLRARFGTHCYPKRRIYLDMIRQIKKNGRQMVVGFLSDQHPLPNDEGHVIKFLNHPTAMISGTEVIARRIGLSVVYFDVRKVSRGHYECTIVPICDDPATMPDGAITDAYARLLEDRIKSAPAYWLWTHNRWKRPVQYPEGMA